MVIDPPQGGKKEKERMKKLFAAAFAAILALSAFAFTACAPKTVVVDEETQYIIIKPDSKILELTSETTLLDYMAVLKERKEIDYTVDNGMVMSINGTENPADWSSCWMLYTDDTENVNPSLTIKYNEKSYSQTNFGAGEVIAKAGCTYIWVYQSFSF